MDDTATSIVYIIIPSQKISLHAPAVIVDLISGLEKRKLFADFTTDPATDLDFKGRKKGKQPLSDYSQFMVISVVYMQLVSQGEKLRFYKIFWIFIFIIDIIGICPGKHSLFDQ